MVSSLLVFISTSGILCVPFHTDKYETVEWIVLFSSFLSVHTVVFRSIPQKTNSVDQR